jgi:two-component system response regulator AtoC
MRKILIVDDEREICKSLQEFLTSKGYQVETACSGKEGMEKASEFEPDLVLLDLRLGDMDGIEVLNKIKSTNPETQVMIMTAYGDVEEAVSAGKAGAYDFVKKPCNLNEIYRRVQNAFHTSTLKKRLSYMEEKEKKQFSGGEIIGESQAMKDILETAEKLSQSDSPTTVLITGESGTGKEMLARALHYMSSRSNRPFVECNCSAIPDNLIESELFGCEKGAFTDAKQRRIGLVELAHTGTLFLDEIADMALPLQAKMLKFIEEKNFRRLGASNEIRVNVRIIAATNKDLTVLINEEKFRSDLYYRLNVFSLELPPLRNRGDDIIILADFFREHYNKLFKKNFTGISESVKDVFRAYEWPGNIREMKNVIERIILLDEEPEITFEYLPQKMLSHVIMHDIPDGKEEKGRICSLEEMESDYIQKVLKFCQNNKTKAARLLGITRNTLDRKLNKTVNDEKQEG